MQAEFQKKMKKKLKKICFEAKKLKNRQGKHMQARKGRGVYFYDRPSGKSGKI